MPLDIGASEKASKCKCKITKSNVNIRVFFLFKPSTCESCQLYVCWHLCRFTGCGHRNVRTESRLLLWPWGPLLGVTMERVQATQRRGQSAWSTFYSVWTWRGLEEINCRHVPHFNLQPWHQTVSTVHQSLLSCWVMFRFIYFFFFTSLFVCVCRPW